MYLKRYFIRLQHMSTWSCFLILSFMIPSRAVDCVFVKDTSFSSLWFFVVFFSSVFLMHLLNQKTLKSVATATVLAFCFAFNGLSKLFAHTHIHKHMRALHSTICCVAICCRPLYGFLLFLANNAATTCADYYHNLLLVLLLVLRLSLWNNSAPLIYGVEMAIKGFFAFSARCSFLVIKCGLLLVA